MVHEVKNGKATRMSFSNIKEVIEMPDLIIDYFKNNKNVIVDKSKYLTIVS